MGLENHIDSVLFDSIGVHRFDYRWSDGLKVNNKDSAVAGKIMDAIDISGQFGPTRFNPESGEIEFGVHRQFFDEVITSMNYVEYCKWFQSGGDPEGYEGVTLKDARIETDMRIDPEDNFIRTAIKVDTTKPVSIDVVAPNSGKLICRLNIACNLDTSWANVDVCLSEDQQGTFMAWREGERVVHESPEGSRVFAVDIKPK